MAETTILLVAGAVFIIAAVSDRLASISVTEAMLALVFGLGIGVATGVPVELTHPVVLTTLEVTLALILFADAARIDASQLRRGYRWPVRMLAVALPLAMIGGAILARTGLGVGWGLALVLGVILAPTDAALAQPVLGDDRLPRRVRQTLNIEAGLNDGLAVPALLVALGLAGGLAQSAGEALVIVLREIGLGALGGLALGLLGAEVIGKGTARGWMNPLHQKVAAVALALAGFAAVQLIGGSGFVATFVGGAVLGHRVRPRCEYLYDFAEAEGRTLAVIAFLIAGAGPVYDLLADGVRPIVWLVAALSLIVVRPLAVTVSLLGERLLPATVLFLGWFGPRGLATLVFALLAMEHLGGLPDDALDLVTATILLSVLAHGLTARPASGWLARHIEARGAVDMEETGPAFEHPMR